MKLSLSKLLNEAALTPLTVQELLGLIERRRKRFDKTQEMQFGVGIEQGKSRIKTMEWDPEQKKKLEKYVDKKMTNDDLEYSWRLYGGNKDLHVMRSMGFMSTLIKWRMGMGNKSHDDGMEQAHADHVQQKQEEMRRFQAAMDEDE